MYSAALSVDHRLCFRPLHAADFHRQSQVAAAAAAAAAVAGFSAFNLHHPSAALGGTAAAAVDRRYYMPATPAQYKTQRCGGGGGGGVSLHGHAQSSSCYRVPADDVAMQVQVRDAGVMSH